MEEELLERLRLKGIEDLSILALSSIEKLNNYGISYEEFKEKIKKRFPFFYSQERKPFNLDFGSKALNEIFKGLTFGNVIDIFGASRTGKSQICFQISLMASLKDYKVYYLDCDGTFRPERIKEMALKRDLNSHLSLSRIKVYRVLNYLEQLYIVSRLNEIIEDSSLLILDGLTHNFLVFGKNLMVRQSLLVKNLQELCNLALRKEVLVLLTNQVRGKGVEVAEALLKKFVHRRIELKRIDKFIMAKVDELPFLEVKFRIGEEGILDCLE
ncbi:MAG: hypothetical protein QXX95_07145 [Nitrososphaerales archaeon]